MRQTTKQKVVSNAKKIRGMLDFKLKTLKRRNRVKRLIVPNLDQSLIVLLAIITVSRKGSQRFMPRPKKLAPFLGQPGKMSATHGSWTALQKRKIEPKVRHSLSRLLRYV
mgnify:CR=1 FL=1